ncbi:heme-degrading domain-containing protein [Mesorhizobium sp. 1B3]|uniref:heme-degrading domain-containing protein n=1 Tax=Mesorhizobium sp. 1B3 TaxID=3243599 RepID=UPI003D97EE00
MATAEDIEKIAEQEAALVFDRFDEATAFAVGSLIRERALADKLPIVVDIQTWDRPLFYAALPGSTGSNANWARRKRNVVKMFLKSTYRMVLEKARPDRTFPPGEGFDPADYVLAGGGFPIHVKGAGAIGVIAVSGLPERQDHEVIVAALGQYFGLDVRSLALGPVET